MSLTLGTFCSGIGSPELAAKSLGWSCAFSSEIDPFASAVLRERHPETVNHGNMELLKGGDLERVNVVCAGTPCQSFSVAGLRKGMADPRGNLALVFLRLLDELRPEWVVWENVPGVLSSNKGRDFGSFLGGLGQLGYGFAYRVLDAQYIRVYGHEYAVPQRRRRVFVVGHLGDWRRAAAVLFERNCLSGNPAPSREAGSRIAGTIASRTAGGGGLGTDFETDGGVVATSGGGIPPISLCLNAGGMGRQDYETETLIPQSGGFFDTAHTLRGEGFDASEDGTGRGTPIVPVPFDTTQITSKANYSNPKPGDPCHPLAAGAHAPAIAYQCHGSNVGPMGTLLSGDNVTSGVPFIPTGYTIHGTDKTVRVASESEVAMSLRTKPPGSIENSSTTVVTTLAIRGREDESRFEYRTDGTANAILTPNGGRAGMGVGAIHSGMAVRRLTPLECERLMGFPDFYTLITYKKKPAADGPRYKVCGNSIAQNAIKWIFTRIQMVQEQPR